MTTTDFMSQVGHRIRRGGGMRSIAMDGSLGHRLTSIGLAIAAFVSHMGHDIGYRLRQGGGSGNETAQLVD
jgi:hypothetical protein